MSSFRKSTWFTSIVPVEDEHDTSLKRGNQHIPFFGHRQIGTAWKALYACSTIQEDSFYTICSENMDMGSCEQSHKNLFQCILPSIILVLSGMFTALMHYWNYNCEKFNWTWKKLIRYVISWLKKSWYRCTINMILLNFLFWSIKSL